MRFILIDAIVEMTPGQSIVAVREVSPEDDYFQDHFPGFPVVPGVLLTEMMAQTAGKCLDAERRARGKAMLAKIRSASFRRWVQPGQRAWVEAEIQTNQARLATAKCRVRVDNAIVAEADLLFSFLALEHLAGEFRDDILEAYFERHPNSEVHHD